MNPGGFYWKDFYEASQIGVETITETSYSVKAYIPLPSRTPQMLQDT